MFLHVFQMPQATVPSSHGKITAAVEFTRTLVLVSCYTSGRELQSANNFSNCPITANPLSVASVTPGKNPLALKEP